MPEQVKLIPWKKIGHLDVRVNLKYYGYITKIIGKFKGRILRYKSRTAHHLRLELDWERMEQFCSEVIGVTIGEVEIKKASANQTKEGIEVKGVGKIVMRSLYLFRHVFYEKVS